MPTLREIILLAGSVGALIGAGTMAGIATLSKPDVEKTQVFPRENKPAVMRLYRPGKDGIMVQDETDAKTYIPLYRYLDRFKNPADKVIEEESIKKIVGWYDD